MNKRRICIVGVGGGGSKIIDRISTLSTEGTILAVVNTDIRALDDASPSRKIRIGQIRTGGSGTGGKPELGKLSAEDDLDKIKPLFKNVKLAIIVAALGGGTGTGAAQVILEQAKNAGCLTLCFVTMPFSFEGEFRVSCAKDALPALGKLADAVIAVPNDLLFEAVGRNNMVQAFLKADETVGTAIRSIWKLITHPGYINLDFADLTNIVRGCGGVCSLAYGTGKGAGKAQSAIQELLGSPLTVRGELLTQVRAVMISIIGGEDLTLKDVGDIMEALNSKFGKGTHVSMGTVIDDAWRNKIMVTIVFSDSWDPDNTLPEVVPDEKTEQGELLDVPRKSSARTGITRKRKEAQGKLGFGANAINRFKDANATILYGEDMDIPTYKRRQIKITE